MIRIAIIDHSTKYLFVEDIDEETFEKEYGGDGEKYIKTNYDLSDKWTWDIIEQTEYIPIDDDPIIVDFEDLL